VNRSEQALTSKVRWSVERPDPARAVVVSRRSIASIVDPAALAILAGLALSLLVPLRRRLVQLVRLPRVREEPS
jgi:hypothetical protein